MQLNHEQILSQFFYYIQQPFVQGIKKQFNLQRRSINHHRALIIFETLYIAVNSMKFWISNRMDFNIAGILFIQLLVSVWWSCGKEHMIEANIFRQPCINGFGKSIVGKINSFRSRKSFLPD